MNWKTSRREFGFERALVMAILNVTPDSFSDGGRIRTTDDALRIVERMIENGADIIDIGGESTRPGGERITADEEIARVAPVIEAVTKRFDVAISVDTWKSSVASAALDSGAEIVNDVSGLLWDGNLAVVAARANAALVLMHLRGTFETMHSQPPADNILAEVARGLKGSVAKANAAGVANEMIALDVGIGFGKTFDQNLELLAKLGKLTLEFGQFPMLVGTSRKSFLGRILDGTPVGERLAGSLASAAVAVWNGAAIVRVHDVRETVDAIRVVESIKRNI